MGNDISVWEVNYPADTGANSSIPNINSVYWSVKVESGGYLVTQWNLQWN